MNNYEIEQLRLHLNSYDNDVFKYIKNHFPNFKSMDIEKIIELFGIKIIYDTSLSDNVISYK